MSFAGIVGTFNVTSEFRGDALVPFAAMGAVSTSSSTVLAVQS